MVRIEGDRYYTPVRIYEWLQARLELVEQTIFDPCCGQDNPTEEVFGLNNEVIENDIDVCGVTSEYSFDASDGTMWTMVGNIDWTITNPPYSQPTLDRIIANSLKYSSVGVAMLLRLSYLEPTKSRREILAGSGEKQLLAVYPCNPRPQFDPSKKGTDSSTVAWFVWGNPDLIEIPPFDFCVDWR